MNDVILPFKAEFILKAYCHGFFPMGIDDKQTIGWFKPEKRAVFDLNDFHISKSLKKILKKKTYSVKINENFRKIMEYCRNLRDESWITDSIIIEYEKIHKMGFAHSLEIYMDSKLAGGLYGVSINGAFFGESMFHLQTNASKIALCELVFRMNEKKMILLDSQFETNHLKQFNIKLITNDEYCKRLSNAINKKVSFI